MKIGILLFIMALSCLAGLALTGERAAQASNSADSILVELARGAWELDQLMAERGGDPANRRKQAIAVLTRMRDSIPSAGAGFAPHPLVDVSLQGFRQDISRARGEVAASPPSYFGAGSVSGACVYCHADEI